MTDNFNRYKKDAKQILICQAPTIGVIKKSLSNFWYQREDLITIDDSGVVLNNGKYTAVIVQKIIKKNALYGFIALFETVTA